jgi:SAM-dependent methyltransferase
MECLRPNRCPRCDHCALGAEGCAACGWQLTSVDGFPAYAPQLARDAAGFDPTLHAQLAELEPGNFWFRARNRLILQLLKAHAPDARTFLEIGCGTGYVLSDIAAAFPGLETVGSELFAEGLGYAARRLPSTQLLQMDARHIPFRERLDVVGAFDVIEHIEEDEQVLREIHTALRPGGLLLLTVPQHPWLWSRQDEFAHHVRRYRRQELAAKLRKAGFSVDWQSSFVTSLLPLLMLSRLRPWKHREDDPFVEFRIPRWLDALLYGALRVEIALLRIGVRLPVGGSLAVAATRQPGDAATPSSEC